MKVSKEEIRYLARLARLQVSDTESEVISEKLSKVLEYMSKLSEADLKEGVNISALDQSQNVFREDITTNRITSHNALSRSPDPDNEYFRVPKVIN